MITPINFFSKETLIVLMDSHIDDNKICLSDYLYNIVYEEAFKNPKLGIFFLDNQHFQLDDDVDGFSLCETYEYPNLREFFYHLNSIDDANSVYLIYSISIKKTNDSLDDLFIVRGRIIENYQVHNNAVFKKHKVDRRNRIIDQMVKNPL
jgi:hypothetical protein